VLGLDGTATLAGARIVGSSCCTDPPVVLIGEDGRARLAGSTATQLGNLRVAVAGELDLAGRTLEMPGTPGLFVDPGGSLLLDGGRVEKFGPLTVRTRGEVVGPGFVGGSTSIAGKLRLDRAGAFVVERGLTLRDSASVRLQQRGGSSDVLRHQGAAYGGTLVLVDFRRPGSNPTLLAAGPGSGRFDLVAGTPSGSRVEYRPTSVRLVRR
jgi:hypothetical protein